MAQIGDKYIIELDSKMEHQGKTVYGVKGFKTLVFDDYGLKQLEKFKDLKPESGTAKRAKIMNHYGLRTQLFKLIEELTEAQTEVIKMLTGKPDANVDNMIEELADVALLTDQIIDHYGQRSRFKAIYDYKLKRTLERIKGTSWKK